MTEYILFHGKKIAYQQSGSGNNLVLLHGFMERKEIWNSFQAELSENYKVTLIDLPGHGESECVAEEHTMGLQSLAIKQVLDELNILECVMIGHSMGGYVTLHFAENYGSMLKGFGLFHSHALADSDEAKQNRLRAIEIVRKNRTVFISNFIPDLFAPENRERLKDEINLLQEGVSEMSAEAIIASQLGMRSRDSKVDVLAGSKVPVLFIFGKQDSRTSLDKILPQTVLPTYSVIHILDVGHMGYLEAYLETLEAVRSFTSICFKEEN